MATESSLKTRSSPFGKFPIANRTLASRTCYASVVCFHYERQNFGVPTNLRSSKFTDTRAEKFVLEEEIASLRISKSIEQAAGTFEIQLHPVENWKQKLSPGDWVMIYMHDKYGMKNQLEDSQDTKNLLMLANVDRVARSLEKDETTDKVRLRYVISGRGFGKVFEESDIWFDPYCGQVNTLNSVTLVNAGLELLGSPTEMINKLIDVFLGPGAKFSNGSTPDLSNWKIPTEMARVFGKTIKGSLADPGTAPSLNVGNGFGFSDKPKFYDILRKEIKENLPGFKARQMLTLDSNGSLNDLLHRSSNQIVNEMFYEDVRNSDGSVHPAIVVIPRPVQTPFFDDVFAIPGAATPKVEPKKIPVKVIVKKGDTLTKIANQNKTTVQEIMRLNPSIKNKDRIFPGQTFTVKETLPPSTPKTTEDAIKNVLNGAHMTLQELSETNFVEISQAEVKYENLGKDEHSRFNLFWLRTTLNFEHAFSVMSNLNKKNGIANPTFIRESIERHGLKRLDQTLEFCYTAGSNKDAMQGVSPAIDLFRGFMAQLYDMHFANHLYDAGTLACTGVLEAELGKALILAPDPSTKAALPKIYYIQGYEHEWRFPAHWTTTFTVTHGQFKTKDKQIFIDASPEDFGQNDAIIDVAYLAKTNAGHG
jgi:LysM repeat protein